MYSAVLVAALATASAGPGFGHRHGCSPCHGCFATCHGCYAPCGGCNGYPITGYGWAGGCYGYHGGCYGGYGVIMVSPYYHGGCTGCYGAYGGFSCYGVPVPIDPASMVPPKMAPAKEPLPPIKGDKKDDPEVVPLPKEKKKIDEKKPDPEKKGTENGAARAKVYITIPEGGSLFVDGQPIKAAPGTRMFQTPPLAPGETYFYDIGIEVIRNGERQRHDRRVLIRRGDELAVDYEALSPSGSVTARTPR